MIGNSRLVPIGLVIVALGGCVGRPRVAPAGTVPVTTAGLLRVQVREGRSLVVRDVPLEDYVAATVLSEFDPPTGDERTIERMYEVQAIVSRSYALAERARHTRSEFDVCSTSNCQLYEPARLRTSRWAALARQATDRTRGEILLYDGAPAHTFFHADCGGHTSSAAEVWGGPPIPYLRAAKDPVDHGRDAWTFDADTNAIRAALNANAGTAVGDALRAIEVRSRDSAGRAEQVALHGSRTVVVRGETFREAMSHRFGAASIRSTMFSVSRSKNGFAFRGKGFGHGVGLCQRGAFARLKAGASTKAVLNHYFPGTTLGTVLDGTPE